MNKQFRNPDTRMNGDVPVKRSKSPSIVGIGHAAVNLKNRLVLMVPLLTILLASSVRAVDPLYHEALRPRFHFTADKGWLNDPNGLVFYQGEYHMFFQRTPDKIDGGLKSWGHAVSTDMLHWKQLPDAIEPDKTGDIWSGSAVVDWNNTAGFQTGKQKAIVAMWTCAGPFDQRLSYSNDSGRTWTKYAQNPVLPHLNAQNRDPKLIWYQPIGQWVVALYLDRKNDYGLFTSPDLKRWTQIQTVSLRGSTECPDFFPLNLDGDLGKQMWILTGASGRYMVGNFDGKAFTPKTQSQIVEYGGNCYAAQTFSDIPPADGRRIQIGWMMGGKYPGMPFNQQMSIPCTLSLRTTTDGPRMFKYPVKEVESLRGPVHKLKDGTLSSGNDFLAGFSGNYLDISMELDPQSNALVTLSLCGATVEYNANTHTLSNGKHCELLPENGKISLRILVDRTSIEVFGNDGRVAITRCFLPADDNSIHLTTSGGDVKITGLRIWEMGSAW
jgi:fructan beta-fructosidase